VESLIRALADDDRELRGFISLALCRIGKPAIEPLTRCLESGCEITRTCAALTLWQMGEEGIGVMVGKANHEGDIKKGT
jgi:HEAT repeat protein